MKTLIIKSGLISMLLFMMGAGCERETTPQHPQITQTGEDTFGCMVNGKIWLPKAYDLFPTKYVVLERANDQRIWRIEARQGFASNFYFGIYEDPLKVGKINITVDESNGIGLYFSSKDFESSSFSWNKDMPGEIIVHRLDTINMILSGTFWFDAINMLNDTVEIRDGRFDLIIDQIEQ